MKSCYKMLKQLESHREHHSGLDLIFLSKYILIIMKVSSQTLKKVFVGYCEGLKDLKFPFVFDPLTHSLTHSLTHPPTHPPTHSLTHSLKDVDGPYILFQHKKVHEMEKQRNKHLKNICD